jgi:SAM-dependent methyltransferase
MTSETFKVHGNGSGSYRAEQLGHTFECEIARLRCQAEMSWAVEQRRLTELGVIDGHDLLELGCGPGFVTKQLAQWLPHSRIAALDRDERMLNVARQTLRGEHDDRVTLLNASVHDTGLATSTFDVAISRYLFQHVDDPVAAAIEIRRVLRPGGTHIIIDVDDGVWGLAEPSFHEFRDLRRRYAEAQHGRGGDRFRGRRLGKILREAGYTGVVLDVFAYSSDDIGLDAFAAQMDPDEFLPLLEDGSLTITEYVRAHVLHQMFMQDPRAFVLSVGFIACAEKPL